MDSGLPSSMAAKAVAIGLPADETLVVLGRYEHVNFIARPRPTAVTIVEVAPPDPPKLWDLVARVLAVAPLAAIAAETRADRPARSGGDGCPRTGRLPLPVSCVRLRIPGGARPLPR